MDKKFKVLFQMDLIEKLNLKTDTTVSLIKAALDVNLEVSISNPEDLTFFKDSVIVKYKRVIIKKSELTFGKKKKSNINLFDYFFIRQDPPFDLNYLTNCYLLELHKRFNKKPRFINDPSGIKNFTEKLFPLYFSKLMPKTLITSEEKVFKESLSKNSSLIIKTLYNKGGEGVTKVLKKDKNAISKFRDLKEKYKVPVVVQSFLSKVSSGDKRVILLDGNPVGLINRVPLKGHFKANLHLGARAEASYLTRKEMQICKEIKPHLKKNKLFFVGIDLIDEKLTEINVTSPTGIVQIEELSGVNISSMLWKKLLKN